MKYPDLTGRVFDRLTVIGVSSKLVNGSLAWDCMCACGKPTIARRTQLNTGQKRSCGCLRRETSQRLICKIIGPRLDEWATFQDVLLEQVTRHPKRPAEIRADLASEWGSFGERRFWRALRMLVDSGAVVRVGTRLSSGDHEDASMYARPTARRVA